MLSKTTIILSVALALGSASAAFAADGSGKVHPAVERQTAVSSRAAHAEVRMRRPSTNFERIWFRQAEGPEWN